VWQWDFGAGIVRTPNNFGMMSQPPSHPELLDWLVGKFVADGWSLKKMHRMITLSEAYQRASKAPPNPLKGELLRRTGDIRKEGSGVVKDPENVWLGRFSGRRLDAEELRDAMLAVSGTLETEGGGPATADLSKPCRSLYVQ